MAQDPLSGIGLALCSGGMNQAKAQHGVTMNPYTARICDTCGQTCNRRVLPAVYCNDVFYLPTGLPAFEEVRGVSVMCQPDVEPFFFLKSLAPANYFLTCVDPFLVCPDFEPELCPSDLAQLDLRHVDEAVFIAPVSICPESREVTANLGAPLVLNRRRRLAKQVDCTPRGHTARFPLSHAFSGLRAWAHLGQRNRRTPRNTTPTMQNVRSFACA